MNIEFNNNEPIYIQIVNNFKILIISGKYQAGEKLPSVRELASILKVNPNTMERALIELEKLNLIYTESTSGKYITKDAKIINKYKEEYAKDISKTYVKNMKEIGYDNKDINKIIGGLL